MHRIDGGPELDGYAASTKSQTDATLIYQLHELGKRCASQWQAQKLPQIGVASSINVAHDYLDDLRVPVAPHAAP